MIDVNTAWTVNRYGRWRRSFARAAEVAGGTSPAAEHSPKIKVAEA